MSQEWDDLRKQADPIIDGLITNYQEHCDKNVKTAVDILATTVSWMIEKLGLTLAAVSGNSKRIGTLEKRVENLERITKLSP